MANIREIAKRANVSVSTVSRVINHHPYVKEEKRKAVLEAMEQLNYIPNKNAVHLAKGKTNRVGIVLPMVDHPYYSQLLKAISEEALMHSYQIVIYQTNYVVEKEMIALHHLQEKILDGVIYLSRHLSIDVMEEFEPYGPIVLCEDVKHKGISSVSVDHRKAFEMAMDYLYEKGHRKIGICLGRRYGTNSQIREGVYRDKLTSWNTSIQEHWILDQCYHFEDGVRIFNTYTQMVQKPTAWVITNDQVAASFAIQCAQNGIHVPKDVALISFDNDPISESLNLTTIEVPKVTMGKRAFSLFIEKMEHNNVIHDHIPIRLYERHSV
ncbi:LacI family DNA-binding transcriptional regulator [Bacillus kexueae]|uniref:LacI family DNA-binding transcriptional regulator n=1 Tax=Aeribacillus kexueae TaxID=2078952 RepID=UPI001FAFEB1A|nr:LacI family DNA-binding transcriptional regulator [Bacillus kexueae]